MKEDMGPQDQEETGPQKGRQRATHPVFELHPQDTLHVKRFSFAYA